MKALFIACLGIASASFAEGSCSKKCDPTQQKLYFQNCEKVNVTPPAGPEVACGKGVGVSADFLYWTVRQDGMFHAMSGRSAKGQSVSKGSIYGLDWKWEPGLRAALSYNLPHDGWDIQGQYTWIYTENSKAVAAPNMVSYWSINGEPFESVMSSLAGWALHFNDAQLLLGRNCYLSQYLKVRPNVGLEAAWIKQGCKVAQVLENTEAGEIGGVDLLELNQDFSGIGLRAGLNTSWQFSPQFSFFGDLGLSILWGTFDLKRKDSKVAASGETTTHINTSASPSAFEPLLSLAAGLRWEDWFADNRYHTLLQAGWEHQLFVSHNQYIKIPTESGHTGDLVLQGLTVRARLDF